MYLQRWHGWCHMKLLPSRRVLCTPYNHAACHFMQSHIHKVYVCLSVTCHLHFWQNDRGLLRATAVTEGWKWYRNKSQHRKSTLENKILLPLQQRFKPVTFWSRVRRSNIIIQSGIIQKKKISFYWFFYASLISCVKFGRHYLGKATTATRTELPISTSERSIFVCQDNRMVASVWDF